MLLYRFPIDFVFFRSKTTPFVIPAKAGIPFFSGCLDSRLRGNDENLLRIGITHDRRRCANDVGAAADGSFLRPQRYNPKTQITPKTKGGSP